MAYRFDSGSLKKPVITPNGFLRSDAWVTKVGVFPYMAMDGSVRRELRHPKEVFSKDSLESLSMLPVTMEHPDEAVTDKNARLYQIGTTGEQPVKDDSYVKSTVQVNDRIAIEAIKRGEKRELSCGYMCDKDLISGITQGIDGVPDGLVYDCIQTNIRYNHVALTSTGRAGPECAVPRLDSNDPDTAVMVTDSNYLPNGSETMETIKIDGLEYKVEPQTAQAFRRYDSKLAEEKTSLIEKAEKAVKDLEKEKARADSADEKAKKAEKERKDAMDPEKVKQIVKDRVDLQSKAGKILGEKDDDDKEWKLDSMSDAEIKKAVIKKVAPGANLDDKKDEYIEARFDHAIETFKEDVNKQNQSDKSRALVNDASSYFEVKDSPAEEARKRFMERTENAWKGEKAE